MESSIGVCALCYVWHGDIPVVFVQIGMEVHGFYVPLIGLQHECYLDICSFPNFP